MESCATNGASKATARSGSPARERRARTKVLLIRFQIAGAVADKSLALSEPERHFERPRDRLSDVLLGGENIRKLAIVILGPKMRRIVRANELRGDAHATAVLPDRAFDEMRDA